MRIFPQFAPQFGVVECIYSPASVAVRQKIRANFPASVAVRQKIRANFLGFRGR